MKWKGEGLSSFPGVCVTISANVQLSKGKNMYLITRYTRSGKFLEVVASATSEDAAMDVALWFYRHQPGPKYAPYRYIVG
jgi:hypothetical protein